LTVRDHAAEYETPRRIILCCFDDRTHDALQSAI